MKKVLMGFLDSFKICFLMSYIIKIGIMVIESSVFISMVKVLV